MKLLKEQEGDLLLGKHIPTQHGHTSNLALTAGGTAFPET